MTFFKSECRAFNLALTENVGPNGGDFHEYMAKNVSMMKNNFYVV